MMQAETANKLKDKKALPVDKSAVYLDTVLERNADAYRLQKDYMFDHAATVAKMIGNGGHYHVTSDHGGVQSEANGVAMGPMMTNAFRGDMKKRRCPPARHHRTGFGKNPRRSEESP